jgi:hypothetical protein
MIIFPVSGQKATAEKPKKAGIKLSFVGGRSVFTRAETMVLSISLAAPDALKETLVVKAVQAENELLLFEGEWTMEGGRACRNFALAAGALPPGTVDLQASCGAHTAKQVLEIIEARASAAGRVSVIANFPAKSAKAVVKGGANAWLLRKGHEGGPALRSLLAGAVREGVSVLPVTRVATAMQSAALPLSQQVDWLVRDATLLGQQAGRFDCFERVMIEGVAPADLTPALVEQLNRPQVSSTLFVRAYAAAIDDSRLTHHLVLPGGPNLPFAAIAPYQFKASVRKKGAPLWVETSNPQHSWLAFAAGANGVVLPKPTASGLGKTVTRLGGMLPLLSSISLREGGVKKARASRAQGGRPGAPSPSAQLTAGPDHLYGFWAQADRCQYLWVFADGKAGKGWLLPPSNGSGMAYELLAGKAIELPKSTEERGRGLSVQLSAGEARLYAFPRRVPVAIEVTPSLKQGGEKGISELAYRADLLDEKGRRISASLPARVTITNPTGTVRWTEDAAFRRGRVEGRLPLAGNEVSGEWTVTVGFSSAGIEGRGVMEIAPEAIVLGDRIRERHALEIEGNQAILKALRVVGPVRVAIHSVAQLPAAEALLQALQQRRRKASIVLVGDLLAKRFEVIDPKTRKRQTLPGPAARADGVILLLDEAGTNPLAQMVIREQGLTPFPADKAFPGPGQGLIQHAARAFSPSHDVVLISGSDSQGLTLAVEYVATQLIGR